MGEWSKDAIMEIKLVVVFYVQAHLLCASNH